MIGAPTLPRHQAIATLLTRLRAVGFAGVTSRQRFFKAVYLDMDSFVAYRDAFPWRTVLDRSFWRTYLPAVRTAARAYQDHRGRVILRRSVTFIMAHRPR
jgi:hypothetical protein